MRKLAVSVAMSALLWAGAGGLPAAWAQQGGDKPKAAKESEKKQAPVAAPEEPSLAQLLGKALKNNPDIRVAEAKVAEADAELNRARLLVTQKVVTIHRSIETQKEAIHAVEADIRRAEELAKRSAMSSSEFERTKAGLIPVKAKLAELEADLSYVVGNSVSQARDRSGAAIGALDPGERRSSQSSSQPSGGNPQEKTVTFSGFFEDALAKERRANGAGLAEGVAAKMRTFLDTRMAKGITLENAPLADGLHFIEDQTNGLSFHINSGNSGESLANAAITLRIRDSVQVGAVLQALEDSLPQPIKIRFVIRDYGILVIPENDIPPGGILVGEFWKAGAARKEK